MNPNAISRQCVPETERHTAFDATVTRSPVIKLA
jgi:hypothetical protein